MPNSDGRSPDTPLSAAPARRRGRKRSVARRLFSLWFQRNAPSGHGSGAEETVEDNAVAAEIADQAEVFATLRISDVMTPRADVQALEVSTPLSEVTQR